MFKKVLMAAVVTAAFADNAAAHEFWIDPSDAAPEPNSRISADYRVGSLLAGSPLPWLDTMVESAKHFPPDSRPVALTSRIGDRPALQVDLDRPGLHRLTTVTHPAYITFDGLDAFAEYLEYEGLDLDPDEHTARGLDPASISEEYIRNAKTLLAVGAVPEAASDSATGMDHELTALGHPFAPEATALTVILTWRGEPVPDAGVALIRAAPGKTGERKILTTDSEGRVTIPLYGAGDYLLNAVHIEPAEGPGAVRWRSV